MFLHHVYYNSIVTSSMCDSEIAGSCLGIVFFIGGENNIDIVGINSYQEGSGRSLYLRDVFSAKIIGCGQDLDD